MTDTSADIRVGDEIRRLLPNGKEEAFVVDDPKFYDAGSFGPHYQEAVSRPRTFDRKTGGNYSIHVSGHNSRVNIDSNDYSNNTVSSGSLFTVDKSGANLAALEALNAERLTPIKVRQNKYLNNVVEQDHRPSNGSSNR